MTRNAGSGQASRYKFWRSWRFRNLSLFVNCSPQPRSNFHPEGSSIPLIADDGAALRFTRLAAVHMVAQPRKCPTNLVWIAVFDELFCSKRLKER